MNRLKELREKRGMNMTQVAAALGMPYTTYVNYEKGAREPNSEVLIQFANFYNVSIDYLIGRQASEKTPATTGGREPAGDILDEVDVAFYGEFQKLDEDQKETVRDMVRVMRERRAKKQEK